MNDNQIITYLKNHYPYLYDLEMEVRRIQSVTGFGEVSFVLHVAHGVADRGEFLGSSSKIYRQRIKNKLV